MTGDIILPLGQNEVNISLIFVVCRCKSLQIKEILVSFGPALVYSKSIQKLAKLSHPESTIVETDGPVPFSACYEGKIAEPSFIPSIVNKLSNLWSIPFDDILEQISDNLKKYIVVRSN